MCQIPIRRHYGTDNYTGLQFFSHNFTKLSLIPLFLEEG